MAVYLQVNLYNAESVSIYKTAATELFENVFKRSSTEGFVINPGKSLRRMQLYGFSQGFLYSSDIGDLF